MRHKHSWFVLLLSLFWLQPTFADSTTERSGKDVPGLSFVNDDVPEGSTNPAEGAKYVYSRSGSQNARVSPVDITIEILDEKGRAIHQHHRQWLTEVYDGIYGWNAARWKEALAGQKGAEKVLQTKSNFFWETLAQHTAERIFGEQRTSKIFLYGPTCLDERGELKCPHIFLEKAQTVIVTTRIDGARDPLNSAERTIVTTFRKTAIDDPEIRLHLTMPFGLKVASVHREVLDIRPRIAQARRELVAAKVHAHIPSGTRKRTMDLDFPDYSLLFVPLKHLVFQGEVADPKLPGSALSYVNEDELRAKFEEVTTALRNPETAKSIVRALEPFMTETYYYMFDGGEGVENYRNYLLGKHGLLRGLEPDFGAIELHLEFARPDQKPTPKRLRAQ